MRISVYYFIKICRNILWFWWVYVPKSFACLLWEILKVWLNLYRGLFGNSMLIVRGIKKRIGPSMGCCPSIPKISNADGEPRRRFNHPSSSGPIVEEQPTRSHAKRPETNQSTKQHLNRPPRKPCYSEASTIPSKIKLPNSGLTVVRKSNADNPNTYTRNRQQSLQSKPEIDHVPLSKVTAWKGNEQNSDCNTTNFTAIDMEKQQSQTKRFMNDQMLRPKIKEPLSPQQTYLKKSTNNDKQGLQPMKGTDYAQISQHNGSVLDFILSDQKEPSSTLKYLLENKETNWPVLNKIDDFGYGNNRAEHFEAKMPSMSISRSVLDQREPSSTLNYPLQNKETYGSISNKVDDPSDTNNRAENSEAKIPSTSYDSQHNRSVLYELWLKQKERSSTLNYPMENKETYDSVSNKVDDHRADDAEPKTPSSTFTSYDSHAASSSTMQSHQNFETVISHTYEPPERPKRTEKANKLYEAGYQESNELEKAGIETLEQFEERNSTRTCSEKDFSKTSNQILENEDVHQNSSILDQGFMEIDSSDKPMIPQKPKSMVDNRDYVPIFRDYNEIDENDLIDDLTESILDSKTYNQMIEMLTKIYEQAKPFHEKIDQFTELENSNAHYYIEESLRRCIDKLDDMFDDIGDVKALTDERKKVYKFVFPMFDRLDATVQENKLRIDGRKE
ncbi:unnamed protein product [Ceutorhynchus assimilis]|uniref:Uncharacterized protein n=1 Tax=Ceutorhynchus assimilis TaxID=467358 RepID=A0A9N9MZ38_9CUCU|nr:unnamed protein product [Ceutorhynchus assimilis]